MHLPIWYYDVGLVVATITTLLMWAHSTEEETRIKAKQLAIWAIVFVLSGFLWPFVIFFAVLAAMGG